MKRQLEIQIISNANRTYAQNHRERKRGIPIVKTLYKRIYKKV